MFLSQVIYLSTFQCVLIGPDVLQNLCTFTAVPCVNCLMLCLSYLSPVPLSLQRIMSLYLTGMLQWRLRDTSICYWFVPITAIWKTYKQTSSLMLALLCWEADLGFSCGEGRQLFLLFLMGASTSALFDTSFCLGPWRALFLLKISSVHVRVLKHSPSHVQQLLILQRKHSVNSSLSFHNIMQQLCSLSKHL